MSLTGKAVLMLIGMIALPCVLMATAFFLAIRRAYRSNSPKRPLFLYPLICSFVMTSGCMAWGYYAVCTSKSSTAALGLFSIPFYSPVIAVAGFLVACSCLYVARFILERLGIISGRMVRSDNRPSRGPVASIGPDNHTLNRIR